MSALDDGLAEVAVAFSSNLLVSRPDIVILRDERDMIYPDRAVPVVAAACCAATAAVRATCAAASMQPRPLLALIPGPGTGPAAS